MRKKLIGLLVVGVFCFAAGSGCSQNGSSSSYFEGAPSKSQAQISEDAGYDAAIWTTPMAINALYEIGQYYGQLDAVNDVLNNALIYINNGVITGMPTDNSFIMSFDSNSYHLFGGDLTWDEKQQDYIPAVEVSVSRNGAEIKNLFETSYTNGSYPQIYTYGVFNGWNSDGTMKLISGYTTNNTANVVTAYEGIFYYDSVGDAMFDDTADVNNNQYSSGIGDFTLTKYEVAGGIPLICFSYTQAEGVGKYEDYVAVLYIEATDNEAADKIMNALTFEN